MDGAQIQRRFPAHHIYVSQFDLISARPYGNPPPDSHRPVASSRCDERGYDRHGINLNQNDRTAHRLRTAENKKNGNGETVS